MRTVFDVGLARLDRRVHRRLDAGDGPSRQVAQPVGVVGQVGRDVGAGPTGQQRRFGEVRVGQAVEARQHLVVGATYPGQVLVEVRSHNHGPESGTVD